MLQPFFEILTEQRWRKMANALSLIPKVYGRGYGHGNQIRNLKSKGV